MKNKRLTRLLCCLTTLILLLGAFPVSANGHTAAVDEAQSLIDGIVGYACQKSGVSTIQQWINGTLTQNAGSTSEWYVLALSQSGSYDFSVYQAALLRYLDQHEVYAATSRQKYALVLIATGSTNAYIHRTLNDSIGQQGVMSWIYGLHLLNNGYSSDSYSLPAVKNKLLSLQLADGGWAVTGTTGDVDVTAMAVQALAPYYRQDPSVKTAVDKALILLSARQMSSGDYASYGVGNPESTAQVIAALSALGIDGETDARFIKGGNTLFDGLKQYRLSDGSFCHKQGGAFNETATVQVFYALVGYRRMADGKSGLYILDGRNPAGLSIPASPTASPSKATAAGTKKPDVQEGTAAASVAVRTGTQGTAAADPSGASAGSSDQIRSGTTARTSGVSRDTAVGAIGVKENTTGLAATATTQTAAYQSSDKPSSPSSYKGWVCLAILLAGGGVCLVLYLTKKRRLQNFIVVIVVAAVAVCAVCATNIQSVEEYYSSDSSAVKENIGTVTLTIRCDTLVGKSDAAHIPEDGMILPATTFDVGADDTVFDVLTAAARQYQIPIESTGSGGSVYIQGIQYIYELDFGDLSGWMYTVNGSPPSAGCGEYRLSDGDIIEWRYTCDLGHDLA